MMGLMEQMKKRPNGGKKNVKCSVDEQTHLLHECILYKVPVQDLQSKFIPLHSLALISYFIYNIKHNQQETDDFLDGKDQLWIQL